MPAGVEIFDADGQLELGITTRLTRIEGEIYTGTSSGSFLIPESSGTPFIVVEDNSQVYDRRGPGVYLSGRTIIWEFSTSPWAPTPRQSYKIKYGYF